MAFDVKQFAEKYLLAIEEEQKKHPEGGTTGFELEWNVYDGDFRPVTFMQKGDEQLSFVDYLRSEHLPEWLNDSNQLEVFHWMTEWVTRPHYSAADTVDEGWLLEACLINALAAAAHSDGDRYYSMHGNLLSHVKVGHDSIPGSWNIAKKRYLERCVDLYGSNLAVSGTHLNLSLPEAMLSWDFMHLAPGERDDSQGGMRFDNYKNQVYVEAARLMRAFAALSIAVTASTPMRVDSVDGVPVVLLTETDSNRNLTFPNERTLDVAHLYRSYEDYVRLSYDLIRRGVRFGNNNWTPVRARSSADPVERIISVTSDQLQSVYSKGLFNGSSPEEMARKIEQENLMARIDLPMSRIELRTDESGHEPELDLAHLTLVELLMLRFYADPEFARAFRYDVEDIARVRRNESAAAMYGMRAEIEDPFTGKPVAMREFLGWTLEHIKPLAQALGRWDRLSPLVEMQLGGPNTAEKMRARIRQEIGDVAIVPVEVLKTLVEEREKRVRLKVESLGSSASVKIATMAAQARRQAHRQRAARIDFTPSGHAAVEAVFADKTSEVVALSEQLIHIPSVTNAPIERLDEVMHAAHFIRHYLEAAGVSVRLFDEGKYPSLLAYFPDQIDAPVMLGGHFDVVPPNPDDGQFVPRIDGDYLWGRGSADMKTVVATYLVWMKDQMRLHGPKPAINLMLVGNEENGETEPFGTPHVLEVLKAELGYEPGLYIAGERTGEKGSELIGEVCVENRGVIRFRLVASGQSGHTGVVKAQPDMTLALVSAVDAVSKIAQARLTTSDPSGWVSGSRFSFFNVGQPGVYNISPTRGEVGVEIRPIPQDNIDGLLDDVRAYADGVGLAVEVEVYEAGVACSPDNPHLLNVLAAVREATGEEPRVGRKLPGTSARFAPGGQAIVWGQTGIGPHAADERHFIPSIKPYYDALIALGEKYRGVGAAELKKQKAKAR